MSETEVYKVMGKPAIVNPSSIGTGRQLVFYPEKGTYSDGVIVFEVNTHDGFVDVVACHKVNEFEDAHIRRLLKLNSVAGKWRKVGRKESQPIAERIDKLGGVLDRVYIGKKLDSLAYISHSKADGRYVFHLMCGDFSRQALREFGLAP
jgi:hypothetical protein